MDREQARQLFSAHQEGELNPAETAEFEAFLDQSADCRAEYDEFQRALALVRGLPQQPAPDGFLDGVQHKIRSRTKGAYFRVKAARPFYYRVPYELFSLLMILVLGALLVLQSLAGSIRPVADPKIRLKPAGGSERAPGAPRPGVAPPAPLRREVIRYRYQLIDATPAMRGQLLDLVRAHGGTLQDGVEGAADTLRLLLPPGQLKPFTSKLLEGLKIKVERQRRFTTSPPPGVEVEIVLPK